MARPIEATPAFSSDAAVLMAANFKEYSENPRPIRPIDTDELRSRILKKAEENAKKRVQL